MMVCNEAVIYMKTLYMDGHVDSLQLFFITVSFTIIYFSSLEQRPNNGKRFRKAWSFSWRRISLLYIREGKNFRECGEFNLNIDFDTIFIGFFGGVSQIARTVRFDEYALSLKPKNS